MGVSLLSVNEESSLDENLKNEDLSFEEALRELEETVAALENGGVPLEKSLDLLKKGLSLADRCETVLAEAELTIEQLTLNSEGELVSEPLEADEDGA
ncbi:exodeoxyribonuclease VII small subunit [bacterium]|nr:MAG: exodeoxyribonuclease VII small subunit [bacterium]